MRKSGSVEKKCSDSARALPPSFRGGQSDEPVFLYALEVGLATAEARRQGPRRVAALFLDGTTFPHSPGSNQRLPEAKGSGLPESKPTLLFVEPFPHSLQFTGDPWPHPRS